MQRRAEVGAPSSAKSWTRWTPYGVVFNMTSRKLCVLSVTVLSKHIWALRSLSGADASSVHLSPDPKFDCWIARDQCGFLHSSVPQSCCTCEITAFGVKDHGLANFEILSGTLPVDRTF